MLVQSDGRVVLRDLDDRVLLAGSGQETGASKAVGAWIEDRCNRCWPVATVRSWPADSIIESGGPADSIGLYFRALRTRLSSREWPLPNCS